MWFILLVTLILKFKRAFAKGKLIFRLMLLAAPQCLCVMLVGCDETTVLKNFFGCTEELINFVLLTVDAIFSLNRLLWWQQPCQNASYSSPFSSQSTSLAEAGKTSSIMTISHLELSGEVCIQAYSAWHTAGFSASCEIMYLRNHCRQYTLEYSLCAHVACEL